MRLIYNNMKVNDEYIEFRDSVKGLRKEFFGVFKQYYNTNGLILRMISGKGIYKYLSNVDLAFQTCELNNYSDKYIINKLYDKNIEKAIENLRVRAVASIYTARAIEDLLLHSFDISQGYVKLADQLRDINDRLYQLAKQSIALSDSWARENNIHLFRDCNFELERNEQKIIKL